MTNTTDNKAKKAKRNSIYAIIAPSIFKEYKEEDVVNNRITVHIDHHSYLPLTEIYFEDNEKQIPLKGVYVSDKWMSKLRESVVDGFFLLSMFNEPKGEENISVITCPLYPKGKYESEKMFPEGMVNGDLIWGDKEIERISKDLAMQIANVIAPTISSIEKLVPQEIRNKSLYFTFDVVSATEEYKYPKIILCADVVPHKSETGININRTPINYSDDYIVELGETAIKQLKHCEHILNAFNNHSIVKLFDGCRWEVVRESVNEGFDYVFKKTLLDIARIGYNCSREGSSDYIKDEYLKVMELIEKVISEKLSEDAEFMRFDVNSFLFWELKKNGERVACDIEVARPVRDYLSKFESSFGRLLIEELSRFTKGPNSKDELIGEFISITDRRPWTPDEKIGEVKVTMVDGENNEIK